MNITDNNATTELKQVAIYVHGMADATSNERLAIAARWLERASQNVCAQGYFGCRAGSKCTSDHK